MRKWHPFKNGSDVFFSHTNASRRTSPNSGCPSMHVNCDFVTDIANFLHAFWKSTDVGVVSSSLCVCFFQSAFFSDVGQGLVTCNVVHFHRSTANPFWISTSAEAQERVARLARRIWISQSGMHWRGSCRRGAPQRKMCVQWPRNRRLEQHDAFMLGGLQHGTELAGSSDFGRCEASCGNHLCAAIFSGQRGHGRTCSRVMFHQCGLVGCRV